MAELVAVLEVAGHPLIPPYRPRKNPQTRWPRRGARPFWRPPPIHTVFNQDEAATKRKGVEIMAHCRYCNRFRMTRLAGRGAWLLECGHTYLPLPSEAQTWAAYTRDPRPAA